MAKDKKEKLDMSPVAIALRHGAMLAQANAYNLGHKTEHFGQKKSNSKTMESLEKLGAGKPYGEK